jgi:cytochrome P450
MKRKLYSLLAGDLLTLLEDPLQEFCRRSLLSPIHRMRIGTEVCHLVSSPAFIRSILLTNASHFDKQTASFKAVRLLLGNGLLTSSGDIWKRQRRLISPSFKSENLRYFLPILQRQADLCVARWTKAAQKGEVVNASLDFNAITLMAVAESLFGDDLRDNIDMFNSEFSVILEAMATRITSIVQLPLWLPTSTNRQLAKSLNHLRQIVLQLIERRRRAHQNIDSSALDQADLLTQLIFRRDPISGSLMDNRQILDEVMTFLIAGHETTANALNWLFVLLHDHPLEQHRLREEVLVSSTCGGQFSIEHLLQMHRCRSVIQEVLRLYPPVWLFSRRALRDQYFDGYRIAGGDVALLCPFALHRIPTLWPNSNHFIADRFINIPSTEVDPFCYLPFGAGKRSCLGAGFAMIEAQVILATILRSFRWSVIDRDMVKPVPIVTLRTSVPVMLSLDLLDVVSF